MNTKSLHAIALLFLISFVSYGQSNKDSLYINFDLMFNKKALSKNTLYISEQNDEIKITQVKFFISQIKIIYDDKSKYQENNSYHLIDFDKKESMKFPIGMYQNKTISKIEFNIGVDSTASVSGALEGALDPSTGMYWSWQSGYINMKIEGVSKSCPTRKNEFAFHIGGYENPNYAMRNIILNYNKNNNTIIINTDLAPLFAAIPLQTNNAVMSPGKKAMEIADKSILMFSVE